MITEAAETTAHVVNELPIPAEAIGLLALTGLMALLFITYAFRSIGDRH
ncbi:hypothetical protein [Demequina sp. NBRC 110053]|nr:hypothetical protein [Demequina sp. NBRC 110053]